MVDQCVEKPYIPVDDGPLPLSGAAKIYGFLTTFI